MPLHRPGLDLDDEMTFLMARYLVDSGFLELKLVVANLHPSFARARFLRGTLDVLGLHDVPVGHGTDGGTVVHKDTFSQYPYVPGESTERAFSILPARFLLRKTFESARNKSLVVLCNSSLKDIALFLRDNEALFVKKVRGVTIMGGVDLTAEGSATLLPDKAHNNLFSKSAADFLYRRCQELHIPLTVVTRNAAYAAMVERSIYDELAATGSLIGWRLRNAQRDSIEGLWRRACATGADRKGLPSRCDRAWFVNTFLGQEATHRGAEDPIWDLVKGFSLYDVIALLAAVEPLGNKLFAPRTVRGVRVIGASGEEHGLRDAGLLRTFMRRGLLTGLLCNHRRKVQVILVMASSPSAGVDEQLALTVLRALVEEGVVVCIGIAVGDDARGEVRASLDRLGLHHVPVGSSSDRAFVAGCYKSALPTGVSLVVPSALTGAAAFIRAQPAAFRDKTLEVIVVGGAERKTASGFFDADLTASNNAADPVAARFVYRSCQELGVRMIVLSRHLAHACRVPRKVVETAPGIESPFEGMRRLYVLTWQRGWQRGRLPTRCTPQWFARTFFADTTTAPAVLPPPEAFATHVWPRVAFFPVYSPLAVLATVSQFRAAFLEVRDALVRSTRHMIVGASEKDTGLRTNVGDVSSVISHLVLKGATLNEETFDKPRGPDERMEWMELGAAIISKVGRSSSHAPQDLLGQLLATREAPEAAPGKTAFQSDESRHGPLLPV